MKSAKLIILLLAPVALYAQAGTGRAVTVEQQGRWISIFNGRNLDGWIPKFSGHELGVNYNNTFRVEEGLLKVSYENYDEFGGAFGHLFYQHPYSHYRIRLEYRFTGDQVPGAPEWAWRNSGIKLHCQPPETMTLDQMSPVSIELQLLGGNGTDRRPTGNVCSTSTHIVMDGELITQHCTESRSDTYHGDRWVAVEAEVRGSDLVRHFINGEEVLSYTDPQYDTGDPNARRLIEGREGDLLIEEGYISLQAESHPVHFRNIEIMPLER